MRFLVTAVLIGLVSTLAISTSANTTIPTVDDGPKKVKAIMAALHKKGLHKKVMTGKATDDEKKQMVDLYVDLVENSAPKGEEIEWKMQAGTAMLAATKVLLGRDDALEEYEKASNCKGCHSKFKGK